MSIIDKCLRLYATQDYFVHYPARPLSHDYWNDKHDPDGVVRDLSAERELRKQDVAYIADYINERETGTVLDIGFGLGELLEQISGRHNCVGLDPSPRALEIAAGKCSARLVSGTLTSDTFEAEHFDAVVSHHVIEHIDEPVEFVRNVFRILAPGGSFICGTPNFASPAARVFQDRFRLLHDPTHVSLFTDDSLLRLLRDEGFVVQRVEYPYFGTRFASPKGFLSMMDGTASVSPAFWGSFVTVFAAKPS